MISRVNRLITGLASLSISILLASCASNQTDVNQAVVVNKPAYINTKTKPNILWIITDDQRPDSIAAYNRAVYGTANSPLGYVESPNADKLAAEGVIFTNAFNNSPACGPSRGSMHSGRYPFRNGHYAFELTHQEPDFVKPTVSQTMRANGYGTATFGKEDAYIFKWGPGQGFHDANLYDYKVHFKHDLQKNGFGDLFTKLKYGNVDGKFSPLGLTETVLYPNGDKKSYYLKRHKAPRNAEDQKQLEATDKEFDLLRSYTRSNPDLIIGGENPKPAGETVDAYIVEEFKRYLANQNQSFKTLWGKKAQGANSNKPQFLHLGFHLPHTPVLPPKSYRDRFKKIKYNVPQFDKAAELGKLPAQLVKLYNAMQADGMTDAEKQQAIQDYYAFCAYGDALMGDAIEAFKQYSKKNNQEYVIIFTVGDHGWHLGEQGIEAKFGPWAQSVNNAAIVVSSDKDRFKPGSVNQDLVEFVDFAPTILASGGVDINKPAFDYLDGYSLYDVAAKTKPARDYVLGEMNLVIGPRAYLHTKRFRFSMRTRPFNNVNLKPKQLGNNIKWALVAPAEKVDMALYDLKYDPLERNNLANDPKYQKLAAWFRNKLGNIVLGDGRVEADWSQANAYHISHFAKGADDKIADIPAHLIP
ncbi:sulfatase [Saccharobesus litoralis]|uniref:Sulfatase n=1 Tax=Saccharobesus litoralis TaxID=2172099 RepID=A0A2S0VP59_9ALTE|nr:sulfatase-like hydrolase/transferase [Saccharobesus litoralis]AWB66005.1 sulfatase [Saccharobesus litoralis]